MQESKRVTGSILGIIAAAFAIFLGFPMVMIIGKAFSGGSGITLEFFSDILSNLDLGKVLINSFAVSLSSGIIATALAFIVAYTINCTNLARGYKSILKNITILPMFLPTITYGFAIIYAFGKQGLITKIFGGHQLFYIYGAKGIMVGYIIYTLPVAFVLINNTLNYIDKKYLIVSKVLGDRPIRTFYSTILRPLSGTLLASVIQTFFLCFTDYGIPIAVGGRYEVIATTLYNQMLGAVPNFNNGAAIAIIMLIPSSISILLLAYVKKFNISYKSVSQVTLNRNRARDAAWGILSTGVIIFVIGIFITVIIVPFVSGWPYDLTLTLEHFAEVFSDNSLVHVYENSIFMAFATAVCGSIIVYASGLVAVRSDLKAGKKQISEIIALVTNTIPGMVLGVAYMLAFSGTVLQSTFILIIICTIIHYYSTPFLMMKSSLEKMDQTWETTARLMGDNWFKTTLRVITPNAISTLVEVFSFYFVNAMVTVSAVIFIVGPETGLLTTKIKELEHFQKFDDIFVLSILILVTNLVVKGITYIISKKIK